MSRNKGKEGEILFSQLMQLKGYKVQDVSANPQYWEQDIDFIITSPTSGLTKTFEVKWDYCINRTGNLYIELTNVHSKGGQGWFKFCKADCLVYGDAVNKVFWVIDMQKLKDHLFWHKYRTASCYGDSTGLIVPLADLEEFTNYIKGELE